MHWWMSESIVKSKPLSGSEAQQVKFTYRKTNYTLQQKLVFPALGWQRGEVTAIRPGRNPDMSPFEVIRIRLDSGEEREFASHLENHRLNNPMPVAIEDEMLDSHSVMVAYGDELASRLEEGLQESRDFVRIAGRWFPRALLVDVNLGHLNLAEAVLRYGWRRSSIHTYFIGAGRDTFECQSQISGILDGSGLTRGRSFR